MPVTEWFIIKSLTVPSSWIAVLLAILITWLVLWRKFGKTTEVWFSDAAVLFLLVWKLSVIITDFNMILSSPLSILYFNGGYTGLYLGLIVALARMLFQLKKKGWPVSELVAILFASVMVQSLYQFLMVIMNEAALWQKFITVFLFLGITILTWLKAANSSTWRIQLSILFLCTHVFVALLQPEGLIQAPLFITILFMITVVAGYFATNFHSMNIRRGKYD